MHRPLPLALALALALAGAASVAACGSSEDTKPSNGVVLTGGGTTTTTSTSSTTSSGGAGGAGGAATTSSAGGAGGASSCSPECASNRLCCDGVCVDDTNDLSNCGKCGRACTEGPHPYCNDGTCEQAPCSVFLTCANAEFCCGTVCCAGTSLCCTVDLAKGPECLATDVCPPGN
jgi:hypothetical protein